MAGSIVESVRQLAERSGFNRAREVADILARTAVYDFEKARRYRKPVDAPVEYRAYAQALRRDGYVLIPDYRPAEVCRSWAKQIMDAIPEPPSPQVDGDESESYKVYPGSRKVELPNGGVIEWRNIDGDDDKDLGIVCFYHVEREFPEFVELRNDPMVSSIISAANGRELPSRAFKCFVNNSAGRTSGYHVDQTSEDQFKTFLFLTDVMDPDDGAHSYVPGTHLPTLGRYLNYGYNMLDKRRYEHDMSLLMAREPVDLLCPAGTLAIVDITGSHRALPQTPGRMRIVLNNCYDEFTYD
jgi:Phytanoyl-CoA dioxygenase (PhyH)